MKRAPTRTEKSNAEDMANGLRMHNQRQLARAELFYRKVLRRTPEHFDALHLMGVVEGQNGNFADSVELLSKAVAVKPDNAAAHNNLGNAYGSLDRHEEALASFDRALEINPEYAKALINSGQVLRFMKRPLEALERFEQAVALKPHLPEVLLAHAETLQLLHRHAEAIRAYRMALEHGGDADQIGYALAALGAEETPSAPPPGYVRNLFDGFAPTFDAHLVDKLGYRTPQLIMDAVAKAQPAPDAVVLDLGCGTGLCGPMLKAGASSLVGVDLSPRMLDRARERGLYDELVCADITEYLSPIEARFDLVVSADVFVYLGDLSAVFAAVRRALRAGGLFVLSVESQSIADFTLGPTRRYAHSETYLRRLAGDNAFELVSLEPCVLREEMGSDVDGVIAVLRPAG
jgi:predicted TPR repeat methyltransferase